MLRWLGDYLLCSFTLHGHHQQAPGPLALGVLVPERKRVSVPGISGLCIHRHQSKTVCASSLLMGLLAFSPVPLTPVHPLRDFIAFCGSSREIASLPCATPRPPLKSGSGHYR